MGGKNIGWVITAHSNQDKSVVQKLPKFKKNGFKHFPELQNLGIYSLFYMSLFWLAEYELKIYKG